MTPITWQAAVDDEEQRPLLQDILEAAVDDRRQAAVDVGEERPQLQAIFVVSRPPPGLKFRGWVSGPPGVGAPGMASLGGVECNERQPTTHSILTSTVIL